MPGPLTRGRSKKRLKSILAAIKAEPGRILFIDEIHILLDPQGGAGGAANLLKPELARGEITVIGATTHAEYRKYIEKDEAFKRRFDLVAVEEPDEKKAVRMLQSLATAYGEHHDLELTHSGFAGIRRTGHALPQGPPSYRMPPSICSTEPPPPCG